MITKSEFKPAWWLRNRHLQTMWGALARKRPKLPLQRERFNLPDDDFIDIDWIIPENTTATTPIVLVLHGLGGSIESHYAINIMGSLYHQSWIGVFMHYRGCSGEPNKKAIGYHSGYTEDLAHLASTIKQRYPHAPLAVVGYSLGGNILLKWLGETGSDNLITTGVAISVPFQLDKAADKMLTGFSRFYQWYILRSLQEYVDYKFKIVESPIDLEPVKDIKTFWEFDHLVTAPIHGFNGVMDYYLKASSRQYLKNIAIPMLILQAKDDPFLTEACIPTENELSKCITLELSAAGGHVGFVAGNMPFYPSYWLEKRICQYLQHYFSAESSQKQNSENLNFKLAH